MLVPVARRGVKRLGIAAGAALGGNSRQCTWKGTGLFVSSYICSRWASVYGCRCYF